MLQTHESDRRVFWVVLSTIALTAAVVAWNVL